LDIVIPLPNNEFLNGTFNIPLNPKSIIIFAHGSDSSSKSPRNKYLANVLNENGFATLLVDLLTEQEQQSDVKSQKVMGKYPGIVLNKFNIHLLSDRLKTITRWIAENESNKAIAEVSNLKDLPIGYFGASTGAAASIQAAADMSYSYSNKIYAIVSRGGRPDLAGTDALKGLIASALFIVGEKDDKDIISLNKKAFKQLKNAKHKDFVLVPKAGHLFDEEPDLMAKVAEVSIEWFNSNVDRNN
jgi:putative phosphoribosyl transferase